MPARVVVIEVQGLAKPGDNLKPCQVSTRQILSANLLADDSKKSGQQHDSGMRITGDLPVVEVQHMTGNGIQKGCLRP